MSLVDETQLPDWVQERRRDMVSKIKIHTGELRSVPWSKLDTQDLEKLLKAVRRY